MRVTARGDRAGSLVRSLAPVYLGLTVAVFAALLMAIQLSVYWSLVRPEHQAVGGARADDTREGGDRERGRRLGLGPGEGVAMGMEERRVPVRTALGEGLPGPLHGEETEQRNRRRPAARRDGAADVASERPGEDHRRQRQDGEGGGGLPPAAPGPARPRFPPERRASRSRHGVTTAWTIAARDGTPSSTMNR